MIDHGGCYGSTTCLPEKKRTAPEAFSSLGRDTKKDVESNLKDSDNNNNNNNGTASVVARTPTMEECVHFLERNQTMRQILGLLIDQEQQEKMASTSIMTDETSEYDDFSGEGDDFSGQDEVQQGYLDRMNDHEFSWYDLTKGDRYLEYEDVLSRDDDAENMDFCSRWNRYNEDDDDEPRPYWAIIPPPPTPAFTIPTLQMLALKAASGQFQRDFKSNEQKHKNVPSTLPKKTESDFKQNISTL